MAPVGRRGWRFELLVGTIAVAGALVVGPAAASSRAASSRGDWAQAGFDPAHTNFNPYERVLKRTNVSHLTASWNIDIGPVSSPAFGDGRVYVATTNALNAYDVTTGARLWTDPQSEGIIARVVVAHGVVYTIRTPHSPGPKILLDAFDATDGSLLWKLPLPTYYGNGFTYANGLLYAGNGTGTVSVVDVATHAVVRKLRGAVAMGDTTVADGRVFVASSGGDLYAYDETTGKRDWRIDLGNSLYSSGGASDGVLVVAPEHDSIMALNEATGAPLWSFSTGTKFVSGVAVADGTVYFGDYSGAFRAFDLHTGAPRWTVDLGPQAIDTATIAHGVVYTSTADKNLHALDARNGKSLFTTAMGARPDGSVVVSHGNVIVAGAAGHLRRWVLPD